MIEMLNEKQKQGLEIAIQRYNQGYKYTTIAGYAGTGKSFLTKVIVQALGLNPEDDVCFATFTGKAAQVLIDRGNKNCLTLHKLLYKAKPLPNGKFKYDHVEFIPYKVVIVDEVSMAPKSLLDDLFMYGCHVIMLGDPYQLPPIRKDDVHDYLQHPHVFLDEIMRQEVESGIITLSMLIREKKPYRNFTTENAVTLPKRDLTTGMLEWADIVLCATNNKRMAINNIIRELTGKTGYIDEGDKLINLHNQWEILSDKENPLTNGVIGYMTDIYESFVSIPERIGVQGNQIPTIVGHFISETGEDFGVLEIDKKCLITGEPLLTPQQQYKMRKDKILRDMMPLTMTYGNCITTHKAQGSEWDKVLVIEEGFPYVKEEHSRWLYTAVTRSAQKCVVIEKF